MASKSRETAPRGSVAGVLVTFEPDLDRFTECVSRVMAQVDALVVVDNGPTDVVLDGIEVIRPGCNVGLAAAQNRGIAWAREHGHSHVLLLDQDSWPETGMVTALRAADPGGRAAAVGPRHYDPRTNAHAPFIRVRFPMSRKIDAVTGTVRCDFLISSGSLIPLAVLDDVGEMDEGLFIDNVDLDWCFRAADRGYELYGVASALMEHPIGDRRSRVGLAQVAQHPPVRLYFIMRNRIALYRRRHTPLTWIAQDIPRVVVKLLTFGVFIGPRRANVSHMLRGIHDGLRGVLGPAPYGATSVRPRQVPPAADSVTKYE